MSSMNFIIARNRQHNPFSVVEMNTFKWIHSWELNLLENIFQGNYNICISDQTNYVMLFSFVFLRPINLYWSAYYKLVRTSGIRIEPLNKCYRWKRWKKQTWFVILKDTAFQMILIPKAQHKQISNRNDHESIDIQHK